MNDTIDSCKCACHENRPPMNTDGLAHDRVCCDEMNGQLEWCEVKRLIAKAVVEARISELKAIQPPEQYKDYARIGGHDACAMCGFNAIKFGEFIDERIKQLNTDKEANQ